MSGVAAGGGKTPTGSLTTNGVVQRDPAAEVGLLVDDLETTGTEYRREVTSRREVPDRVRDVPVRHRLTVRETQPLDPVHVQPVHRPVPSRLTVFPHEHVTVRVVVVVVRRALARQAGHRTVMSAALAVNGEPQSRQRFVARLMSASSRRRPRAARAPPPCWPDRRPSRRARSLGARRLSALARRARRRW